MVADADIIAYEAMVKAMRAYEPLGVRPVEAARHMCVVSLQLLLLAGPEDPLAELDACLHHVLGLIAELEQPAHTLQ